MNTRHPLASAAAATAIGYICGLLAFVALLIALNWRHVGPEETEVVARTCVTRGMVARLDAEGSNVLVYCQKPEEAGPPKKR